MDPLDLVCMYTPIVIVSMSTKVRLVYREPTPPLSVIRLILPVRGCKIRSQGYKGTTEGIDKEHRD